MSQAKTIYKFLTHTKNKAADKALLYGHALAEEPYRLVILETLLDRSEGKTTEHMIESYHKFEPQRQQLLINRVGNLYTGLRRASQSENAQTRLNTLSIIKSSY